MSEKFQLEIIFPDRSILKTDASEVVIPSYEGEMGILKDHSPLITFLRPGLIKVKNGIESKYFVEEGTVEFAKNNLLILTSTVKELSKIEKGFIEGQINEAEKKIKSNELSDKEKYLLSYKLNSLKAINQ